MVLRNLLHIQIHVINLSKYHEYFTNTFLLKFMVTSEKRQVAIYYEFHNTSNNWIECKLRYQTPIDTSFYSICSFCYFTIWFMANSWYCLILFPVIESIQITLRCPVAALAIWQIRRKKTKWSLSEQLLSVSIDWSSPTYFISNLIIVPHWPLKRWRCLLLLCRITTECHPENQRPKM